MFRPRPRRTPRRSIEDVFDAMARDFETAFEDFGHVVPTKRRFVQKALGGERHRAATSSERISVPITAVPQNDITTDARDAKETKVMKESTDVASKDNATIPIHFSKEDPNNSAKASEGSKSIRLDTIPESNEDEEWTEITGHEADEKEVNDASVDAKSTEQKATEKANATVSISAAEDEKSDTVSETKAESKKEVAQKESSEAVAPSDAFFRGALSRMTESDVAKFSEDDENYFYTVSYPDGTNREDINVSYENGMLKVESSTNIESEDGFSSFSSSSSRSHRIPSNVDLSTITCTFNNDKMLKISLPKVKEASSDEGAEKVELSRSQSC